MFIRASAPRVWSTSLVGPATPQTVTPNGAIKQPTDRVTDGAGAFDEPTVLTTLDIDRLAGPPLGGGVQRKSARQICEARRNMDSKRDKV